MSRNALFNLAFGFAILFLAAAAGAIVAVDTTDAFLRSAAGANSWAMTIQASSHGHTNLFGLLHIVFGLTLPYSRFPKKVQRLQTVALALGTVAMGPVMIARSFMPPPESTDFLTVLIGIFLSCSLAALASHSAALFARLSRP
jgi:hypothetical protein